MSLRLRQLAGAPAAIIAIVVVAALVFAAIPTTNASHLAPGTDVVVDTTIQASASWNGSYLGSVSPASSPPGFQMAVASAYNLILTNITPTGGDTRVEIVSPNGTVRASTDLGTGSNATVRNATFVLSTGTIPGAGVYHLRGTSSNATYTSLYFAPQAIMVTVSPNPITYTAGQQYVITYSTVSNATLIGPCIPAPATTDSNGNFAAIQSCPGVGTHTVTARKQTSSITSNGVDVPEYEGETSYSVVASLPKVSIANVSGSVLYPITTPIRLENVTDFGSATVKLTFDPSVVEVLNVTNSSIPNATITWNVNASAGTMTVLVTTTARPGANGTFNLAQVEMRAIGGAGSTSALDLTIEELVTSDGFVIHANAIDGSFRAGILGDADGDGDIDQNDVLAISDVVVGRRALSTIVAVDADVSRDGVVTGKDAMFLKQHLAGTRATL